MPIATEPGHPERTRRPHWITATLLALVLVVAAACGGDDDSAAPVDDTATQADDDTATQADDDAAAEAGDTTESSGSLDVPANVLAVDGTSIDETVYGDRFEWSIGGVRVTEPAGAAAGSVDIVFDTQVYNVFVDPFAPSTASLALLWGDPGTGDTFTTPLQADFPIVPGEATSTSELRATLTPQDQETFDADTAYLQIGRAGQSPAIVPLGSGVELVDRLPVPQDTDGWTFVVAVDPEAEGGTLYDTVTVTDAYVLWISPEDARGVPDGSVVLEVFYDIDNGGQAQSCSDRGVGGWTLTGPDGDAVADLGVSERCVEDGESEAGVFTAFIIGTDTVEGDYVLGHTREAGGEEATGEVTVTLTSDGSVSFRDIG